MGNRCSLGTTDLSSSKVTRVLCLYRALLAVCLAVFLLNLSRVDPDRLVPMVRPHPGNSLLGNILRCR